MDFRSSKTKDTLFVSVLFLVNAQRQFSGLVERQYSPKANAVITERSRVSKFTKRPMDGMLGFCFDGAVRNMAPGFLERDENGR